MLDNLTAYFDSLSPAWFYIAFWFLAFLENVLPPVPGDTVAVLAAYIVGRSQQRFVGTFIATDLGTIGGFMAYYFLGCLVDAQYFARKNFRFLPASRFEKAGQWFRRFGGWVVLANRLLAGLRSAIAIVCGIYRLPLKRVLFLTTIGCSIWNLALMWVGYMLGANWRVIEEILREYSRLLLAFALMTGGVFVLRGGSWCGRRRE